MITLDLTGKTKAVAKPKVEVNPTVENKAAAEEKPKSRKKWIVVGTATMVVAVAYVSFFVFPNLLEFGKASENWERKKGVEHVKAVLALDPFLVNLADEQEVRFLKASFQLGLAQDPSEDARNSVVIAAIRDSIISLLSSKTAEQILTSQGKEKLREEIRVRVNSISPKLRVLDVYIVDFVIQL
jgi:flagellar FliL protein